MVNRNKKSIILPGAFFIVFIISMCFCYTINEGERGVLLRYGKIIRVAPPGLNFRFPLIEKVNKISVNKHTMLFNDIRAYSRDQQPALVAVSVNFHIPASEVVSLYVSYMTLDNMKERLIARKVPAQFENVFGQYTALSAIQDRQKLIQDFHDALQKSITGPMIIDSVQIEHIDFSDEYENSIEERMKAEVDIATRKQNLKTAKIQAEISVTQAEAQAESQLLVANAAAESIRLKGAAEAEAIRLRGEALRNSPELVKLSTAEKWDGKLPSTMIPGGSVPFIETK